MVDILNHLWLTNLYGTIKMMISRANDVQGSISGKKFLPKTLLSSFEQTFEQFFMKDGEEIFLKTLIRVSISPMSI